MCIRLKDLFRRPLPVIFRAALCQQTIRRIKYPAQTHQSSDILLNQSHGTGGTNNNTAHHHHLETGI